MRQGTMIVEAQYKIGDDDYNISENSVLRHSSLTAGSIDRIPCNFVDAPTTRGRVCAAPSKPISSPKTSFSLDRSRVNECLSEWLGRVASGDGLAWLNEQKEEIASGAPRRTFYTSFSAVPRYIDKHDLDLSAEDLAADEARSGRQPVDWSADQAGRTLIVLSLPHEEGVPARARPPVHTRRRDSPNCRYR